MNLHENNPAHDEDRVEWEWAADGVREDGLADWAFDLDGARPFDNEIEELSAQWLLPECFLRELAAAPNPWDFLSENETVLGGSRDRRYERFRKERAGAA